MKLYQAEWCPFSHRVRAKLAELSIDYELVNVPASSNKRRNLEKVAGTTAIPVLVDGQRIISDSDEALTYLEKKYGAKPDELELHHRELSPGHPRAQALLDEYEREQRAASGEVQSANAAIFRNMALSNPVAAAARSVVLRGLSRIGPAVRRMTEKEALVTQELRSLECLS